MSGHFKPATRKGTFVLIGLTGHSGSGKTYSAILLARGLAGESGKIAFIDTENGRGSMYSNLTPYDIAELTPPFTSERYAELVEEAEKNGANVLIIDSFSHEHEGEGGYLEFAESQRNSNDQPLKGLQKWLRPKIRRKKLVNAILLSKMHIIICMRGKNKLKQIKDEKGKEVIVDTGVVPIQDPRFLYEMTVGIIMDETTQKPRVIHKCPDELKHLFSPQQYLGIETGRKMAEWVGAAEPIKIDELAVKKEAKAKAADGVEAFRKYWSELPKEKRDAIRGSLNELQSDAEQADKAKLPPPLDNGDDNGDGQIM